MIERLDDRPAGSALPADIITWTEDVDPVTLLPINIGPNAYTWTVKAYAATDTTFTTALFTKTTGLTTSSTTLTIAWALADLPTLAAGDYKIRLTGTLATLPRIHDLSLKLT